MNDDLRELLDLLTSHNVEFVIIGAHAVGFYARPRMTEDVDVFVGRTKDNANRLANALEEFGAKIGADGAERFSSLDRQMIRIGVPPNMVDILNFAGTHAFEDVWSNRKSGELFGFSVFFPSIDDLIEMKQASGRAQDLADIELLRKVQEK